MSPFPCQPERRTTRRVGITLLAAASPAIWLQESFHQQFAGAPGVLHHGGQWWIGEACGRDVVESHDAHLPRHVDTGFLQRAQRTDGDEVAGRDDGIESNAARQKLFRRLKSGFFGGDGVHLQGGGGGDAGFHHGALVAAVAIEELRIVARGRTQERDGLAARGEQMPRDFVTALEVVAAHGDSGLALQHGPPAHEVCALFNQAHEARPVFFVVAVPQQDDAVGFAAVFVVLLPVA